VAVELKRGVIRGKRRLGKEIDHNAVWDLASARFSIFTPGVRVAKLVKTSNSNSMVHDNQEVRDNGTTATILDLPFCRFETHCRRQYAMRNET
jgi:hypothetical protein